MINPGAMITAINATRGTMYRIPHSEFHNRERYKKRKLTKSDRLKLRKAIKEGRAIKLDKEWFIIPGDEEVDKMIKARGE